MYSFCVCGMIKSRVNIQIGFFSEMRICVLIFEQWNILMWSDLKYLFSIEGGTNWFCYHSCVCLLGPLASKLRLSLSGSLDAILEKSLNTSLNVTSPETKKWQQLVWRNIPFKIQSGYKGVFKICSMLEVWIHCNHILLCGVVVLM